MLKSNFIVIPILWPLFSYCV